jgi:hypothetical protein
MGQEKGGAGSRNKPERERLEGLDSSIKITREIPGVLYLGDNQPCMSDRWKCRSGSTGNGVGVRSHATSQLRVMTFQPAWDEPPVHMGPALWCGHRKTAGVCWRKLR